MSLNSLLVEEVDDKLGEVTSQAGKNIFTKKFWVWMLCIFLYLPGIHFAPPASQSSLCQFYLEFMDMQINP